MNEPHDHHDAHPASTPYFTEAELASLHASDLSAARAVVSLLLSVFCTGIAIYSFVVYSIVS